MIRAGDLGLSPVERPDEWESYYAQVGEPEQMPWFSAAFDSDIELVLERNGLSSGRVLDIGTGPGNHAMELARRGFDVTGIDLSPSAIRFAEQRSSELGVNVRFIAGSILDAPLEGVFDLAFDRGCFHCIPPASWPGYASAVAGHLGTGALFLLKTFSHLDQAEGGPHRFHPDELDAVFAPVLQRLSLDHTVYRGTMPEDDIPKALFTVWRKPA